MLRKIKCIVWLSLTGFVLLGCSTSEYGSSSRFTPGQQMASQARRLMPGDAIELSVEVDGVTEVSGHQADVNRQGVVTLPLIGDVEIGGMKLSAAREIITKTYGNYYVNPPVVMLSLAGEDGGEWGYVTVLGRVQRPGRVPLDSAEGINLSAAIQLAEGFAPSAKTSDIRITRTDELGLKTRVSIDFEEIGQSGDATSDVLLIEGDIVYVPERIF